MCYISQFIGKKYQICDIETTRGLKETKDVKEMGNFPEENSIKIIGDTIVVKLSD